jgi:hypothetical protein
LIKNVDSEEWEYKEPIKGLEGKHVGPYAEDMKKIGLSDGNTVNPADTAGLALAGVQKLISMLEKKGALA